MLFGKLPTKRFIGLLLAVVMVVSMLQNVNMTAMAALNTDTRVSDPSTMDGWKEFFGKDILSTENAGAVWTDKSVFTDDDAFSGTGIAMNGTNDSFLVALSAIASNTSVTGMSNAPTDTMLILDLSSSMYTNNGYKHPTIVQTMLKSVNSTIEKLQKLSTTEISDRTAQGIGCRNKRLTFYHIGRRDFVICIIKLGRR